MAEKYNTQLQELASELVTPERFAVQAVRSMVEPVVEPANVLRLFPDLPEATIHYFPDRSGESL